jgi:hypothetical protein
VVFFSGLSMLAQDSLKKAYPEYFRKEEVIYDGKRYRKYNNYLTLGGGFLSSSLRDDVDRAIGGDFHFHIRRQYFQIGALMSGPQFLSNNNVQGHFGAGLRRERSNSNLAIYGGLTYFTGVITVSDSSLGLIPRYYQGVGAYICAQAMTKLTYDIGAGVEAFAEVSKTQGIIGFKLILFFSGAYVGVKKNYNPNVRSERGK